MKTRWLWQACEQFARLILEACARRSDTFDRHPVDLFRDAWVRR